VLSEAFASEAEGEEVVPQPTIVLLVDEHGGVRVSSEDNVDGLPQPGRESVIHYR